MRESRIKLEEGEKLWKVYANCVRRPAGRAIMELTIEDAEELISEMALDEDYINNPAYELERDEDGFITDKAFEQYLEYVDNGLHMLLNRDKFIDAGDFQIKIEKEMPDRPNTCYSSMSLFI